MLPKKIERTANDPNDGLAKHDTGYKRPEQIDTDTNERNLLRERLAGQHKMMGGSDCDMALLDRTDKSDWPETPCVDTEPSILPE